MSDLKYEMQLEIPKFLACSQLQQPMLPFRMISNVLSDVGSFHPETGCGLFSLCVLFIKILLFVPNGSQKGAGAESTSYHCLVTGICPLLFACFFLYLLDVELMGEKETIK